MHVYLCISKLTKGQLTKNGWQAGFDPWVVCWEPLDLGLHLTGLYLPRVCLWGKNCQFSRKSVFFIESCNIFSKILCNTNFGVKLLRGYIWLQANFFFRGCSRIKIGHNCICDSSYQRGAVVGIYHFILWGFKDVDPNAKLWWYQNL